MDDHSGSFSEDFKSLWELGSRVRSLWDAFESLYSGLLEMAQKQAVKQSSFRSFEDIEHDLLAKTRPMETLYVEWMNLLWNRIVLRTQLKVRDSIQLLFYSCNTANAYGCALSARSVIEHTSLLEYLSSKVPWRNHRAVPKAKMIEFTKQLYKLALGSRFSWDEMFKGSGSIRQLLSSGEWDRPKGMRIPHISELVGELDKTLFSQNRLEAKGQIKFLYTILCDVVHPSWGGDFIYSPNMYRDMVIKYQLDDHFKRSAILFLLPIIDIVRHFILLCEELSGEELRFVAATAF